MTVGQILSWLVTGLVVGLLARLIVPGRQPMGIFMTIVLGIVGALAGNVIYNLYTYRAVSPPGGFDVATAWPGWIFALLGGIVVLLLYVVATGRRSY